MFSIIRKLAYGNFQAKIRELQQQTPIASYSKRQNSFDYTVELPLSEIVKLLLKTNSGSTSNLDPKPVHTGQAPCGALKLNSRGSSFWNIDIRMVNTSVSLRKCLHFIAIRIQNLDNSLTQVQRLLNTLT